MRQQLKSERADDIRYVPLHAIYLPYGETKSGQGTPKRSKHTQLIERIVNGRDPILVVRGIPGAGKSVAMRQVTQELVKLSADSRRKSIPIFIPLGQIGSSVPTPFEGSDWVLQQIRGYLDGGNFESRDSNIAAKFISRQLESLLEEGRCVIIFDGMDELPRHGYDKKCQTLVQFAQRWTQGKANRIIFSCREFDYPKELRIHSLVLLQFDWKDVEKYLKHHVLSHEFPQRDRKSVV